jgi:beta-carotene hydroxylase
MRGRWLPALFLQHTYHLEHHLYPRVPAHNWLELSRRLDPHLDAAGVAVQRLP